MTKSEVRNLNVTNKIRRSNSEFQVTRGGFTLIELLVSIAIFVIFLGVVSVAYIGIIHSQRQANEVRKMYSDVRTFTESLGQDMRLGTIDYDCYGVNGGTVTASTTLCPFSTIIDPVSSSANQSPYLAIVNNDRTLKIVYWFDKTNSKLKVKKYKRSDSGDNVDIAQWSEAEGYSSQDEGADTTGSKTLLSDAVAVKNLIFSVNPPVNPYSADHYQKNEYQFQPKVTLSLLLENAQKNMTPDPAAQGARQATASQPPFHLNFQTTLSSRVYSRSK